MNLYQLERVLERYDGLLDALGYEKPNDRSELDRRIAICITDLQKARAVYKDMVLDWAEKQEDGEE